MLNILQITYIMYLLWTLSYIQTICMLFNHYCLKKYVVVCPPSRLLSYIFIVVMMVMMDQACEYDEPFPKSTCSTCSLSQCEQMLDWKGEKIEKIITVVVGCHPRWSDFPDPTKEHLIENKGIFAKSDLKNTNLIAMSQLQKIVTQILSLPCAADPFIKWGPLDVILKTFVLKSVINVCSFILTVN